MNRRREHRFFRQVLRGDPIMDESFMSLDDWLRLASYSLSTLNSHWSEADWLLTTDHWPLGRRMTSIFRSHVLLWIKTEGKNRRGLHGYEAKQVNINYYSWYFNLHLLYKHIPNFYSQNMIVIYSPLDFLVISVIIVHAGLVYQSWLVLHQCYCTAELHVTL